VQITGWDWDFSFSVNMAKWRDERFSDYRHLIVLGTLLRPRKLKAETVELSFIPSIKPKTSNRSTMSRRRMASVP
jgi:hypothetical protein